MQQKTKNQNLSKIKRHASPSLEGKWKGIDEWHWIWTRESRKWKSRISWCWRETYFLTCVSKQELIWEHCFPVLMQAHVAQVSHFEGRFDFCKIIAGAVAEADGSTLLHSCCGRDDVFSIDKVARLWVAQVEER